MGVVSTDFVEFLARSLKLGSDMGALNKKNGGKISLPMEKKLPFKSHPFRGSVLA